MFYQVTGAPPPPTVQYPDPWVTALLLQVGTVRPGQGPRPLRRVAGEGTESGRSTLKYTCHFLTEGPWVSSLTLWISFLIFS